MKTEGNAGPAVAARGGVDLPTEKWERPAHWPQRAPRASTSPIPPPSSVEDTRAAERAAAATSAREDRERASRERAERERRARASLPRPKAPTGQRTPPSTVQPRPARPSDPAEEPDTPPAPPPSDTAAARAERVAARLAQLEREAEERARRAEQLLAERQAARAAAVEQSRARAREVGEQRRRKAAEARAAFADDLRRLYAAGDSIASIAETLGVSPAQVNRMRKEFGIARRRPALDRAQVVALYREHRSVERVAADLGTTTSAVRYHLAQAGVAVRAPGDNGSRLPEEVRRGALTAYASGEPCAAIYARYGITETTLIRWRNEAGLPGRRPGRQPAAGRLTPEEVERLVADGLARMTPEAPLDHPVDTPEDIARRRADLEDAVRPRTRKD